MRFYLLGLALWVWGTALQAEPMRVISWNLEWFPGREPNPEPNNVALQMRRAQRALEELKPDLFLIQEVNGWKPLEELVTVVPGMQVHTVSRFEDSSAQQVGIASRLTAESSWSESWQSSPSSPPRGFAFSAIRLPSGGALLVWTVHLKANGGEAGRNFAKREESSRQLQRHVREMLAVYLPTGPCSILIAGDWNTSLDDPRFAHEATLRDMLSFGLDWGWNQVPFSRRVTLPARGQFGDTCFDHAFTHGLEILETRSVRGLDEVSDHQPLLMVVEPRAAKGPLMSRTAEQIASILPSMDRPASSSDPVPPTVSVATAGTPSAEARRRPASEDAFPPTDAAALAARVGQRTTVRGVVDRVGQLDSGAITFINFKGVSRGGFVAIVRHQHLDNLEKAAGGRLPEVLRGQEIEVEGDISLYRDIPQIELERATSFHYVQR
jgi:endonuclease/exonuclease/phosphatase family metal-dependent hydrolase